MKHPSRPSQMTEPDMALLYLGYAFETLQRTPAGDPAELDALARHIVGEAPKTLLGMAIAAHAERWLRRHLWSANLGSLSPSDQAARLVIDSATHISGS